MNLERMWNMGKIVAITNSKGGVGKTATALNLGAALSDAGKKVLLIDNDPQGNLTAALGYTPQSKSGHWQISCWPPLTTRRTWKFTLIAGSFLREAASP